METEIIEAAERLQRSLSIDAEEKSRRYQQEGKEAAQQGKLHRSLELFLVAYELQPSEKLKRRIQRLQDFIQEEAASQEEEEEDFINVKDSGLMLYKELHGKLYDYQKEGVAFLYSLHRDGLQGGILADDMGLGKTIQVISFLSGMYDAELTNHTLLVMPTSLIKNWVREFAKWTPGMQVKEFHGINKVGRNRNLERIQRKGGIIITTYQMLINNWQQLATFQEKEFCWDYVILDEAHKIKTSSTKTAKCAHAIPARHRLLLTGTPVQNNLREMWALFDFACQGALLGTAKTFKTEYENPITRAREKDATPGEKALGLKISQNLKELIKPYFLRRTKAEVQHQNQSPKETGEEEKEDTKKSSPAGDAAEMPSLTRKNDLIVWTYLSPVQEDVYQQFISLDHIKALLMTTRSPLAELTVLKKLCDHPRLLSARAVTQLGLAEGSATEHAPQEAESESGAGCIDHISDETLLEESGKLRFLVSLLERLREENHRTLVFSQSRKMLDIIERVLRNRKFQILRVDGTVTQLAERERRISLFQTGRQYSVFLLTTQVGGVGITLTAANRVVIFDPSWNPATDAQAVDRAYRIGQTEDVVIYRLITCGTVEEKIYRRQVFKDSLIRQTTGDKKNPYRYFSKQELKELFTLEDTRASSTQLQLQALHSQHRRSDSKLDSHIAELHRMEMFGISDHDLLFSKEATVDEDNRQDAETDLYIRTRVQKAQELVQAESELHGQLMDSITNNMEPAWLTITKQHRGTDEPTERAQGTHMSGPPVVVDLTQSDSDKLNELSFFNEVENVSEAEDLVQVTSECVESGVVVDLSHRVAESSLVVVEESCSPVAEGNSKGFDPSLSPSLQELSPQTEDEHKSLITEDHKCIPLLSPHSNTNVSDVTKAELEVGLESSDMSAQAELFPGSFNLQLEDSADLLLAEEEKEQEQEQQEELDPAEVEGKFQLQLDVSEGSASDFSMMPQSAQSTPADESFVHVVRRRKKGQIICDSEDEELEEEEVEKPSLVSISLDDSFKSLSSSTPKSAKCNGAPSRRSMNTSVASRRSFVQSLLEDLEEEEDDIMEGPESGEEEEPCGETLNSENTGEEMSRDESREEVESKGEQGALEESTGGVELGSSEVLQLCAPKTVSSGTSTQTSSFTNPTSKPPSQETYEALVKCGKRRLADGKKQEALDLFLKAIDINNGDGEIQLLIIQLYRQLSQR